MDTYSLVMENVTQKLQSGKKIDAIVDELVESIKIEFNNEIDVSFIYDTLAEINTYRFNTYDYLNQDELEDAFKNTLEISNIETSNTILVDALRTLAKYDKLVEVDDIPICAKLNLLINILDEYKYSIIKHKKLSLSSALVGGIATYPNSNIFELIIPRQKALDEALYLNNDDSATLLTKKIISEFQDDSYKIDFSLNALQFIGKDSINYELVAKYKIDIAFNIRYFLNASLPLKENDFFKSAQILSVSLYKKYTFIDGIMNLKKKLSQAKVLTALNIIMEHYIGIPKSSIDNTYFLKPVQLKSHFFNTAIYEFRTESNLKLHPVFENKQEQENILKLIS
ncbi:MAG: hypothetical protein OQK48_03625 [Sulfurimonas sp.]|uniref:hypothetical protein n=1 Tax=Sulfurimonas sp. TaxID=2022749 RepID=UPI002625E334|nr:hypothetical protein [Sulfurimonas sp.]MCW8894248.1 hypothetical protein [Sulfurimonas sp.]MCW8954011.1 hypothetical protein [Sulfurimonas sp.]MCW9067065.1 hypothetical protein [Sulfurimonas sp.]